MHIKNNSPYSFIPNQSSRKPIPEHNAPLPVNFIVFLLIINNGINPIIHTLIISLRIKNVNLIHKKVTLNQFKSFSFISFPLTFA